MVAGEVLQSLNISLHKGEKQFIGSLHIRRGDAKGMCDTSPEKIKRYLECSFANTQDLGDFTVLLSTDEEDPAYIEEVQSIPAGNETMSHIRILWLDSTVRNITMSLIETGDLPGFLWNNYFVFVVSNRIWKFTSFEMAQRRNFDCSDCNPVRNLISR